MLRHLTYLTAGFDWFVFFTIIKIHRISFVGYIKLREFFFWATWTGLELNNNMKWFLTCKYSIIRQRAQVLNQVSHSLIKIIFWWWVARTAASTHRILFTSVAQNILLIELSMNFYRWFIWKKKFFFQFVIFVWCDCERYNFTLLFLLLMFVWLWLEYNNFLTWFVQWVCALIIVLSITMTRAFFWFDFQSLLWI